MSKKKENVLFTDNNLNTFHKDVKAIANKENGLISAQALFIRHFTAMYDGQKNIHLNLTNPSTKKSNLTKDQYVKVLDVIAQAIFNAKDYKLYKCADITQAYGFKKKTSAYRTKAKARQRLQQQPASRCNKLAQALENAAKDKGKNKGGSRQGTKYEQIDKLFTTLITKLNANANDKSIKFVDKNDLESIKKHITNARACISKA
tara:strand:+ start:243 stop:854 length:612 start_codon:yes stop_codon:yes gene_type:complete